MHFSHCYAFAEFEKKNFYSYRFNSAKDGFLKLAELKQLKELTLDSFREYPYVTLLLRAFVNANIRLDFFSIKFFKIGALAVKSLTKLKTINTLHLTRTDSFFEKDLILMASALPLLTNLTVETEFRSSIALIMDGLITFVRTGKQLNSITLNEVRNLRINQSGFDSLLNAVKSSKPNREFYMNICGTGNGFDGEIRRSIQKQLEIEFVHE